MCSVAYVSRHRSSGSDGQASAATRSILGEGIVGMLRCVPVGRVVAAERGAAFLTRSEMHPLRADLHALVAHAPLWLLDRGNRGPMRAGSNSRHGGPLRRVAPCAKLTVSGNPRRTAQLPSKNERPRSDTPRYEASCFSEQARQDSNLQPPVLERTPSNTGVEGLLILKDLPLSEQRRRCWTTPALALILALFNAAAMGSLLDIGWPPHWVCLSSPTSLQEL